MTVVSRAREPVPACREVAWLVWTAMAVAGVVRPAAVDGWVIAQGPGGWPVAFRTDGRRLS